MAHWSSVGSSWLVNESNGKPAGPFECFVELPEVERTPVRPDAKAPGGGSPGAALALRRMVAEKLPRKNPARRRARRGAPWAWAIGVAAVASGSLGISSAPSAGEDCVPEEPPDYRLSDYRTPVPCTLAGATVVSTEALRRLIEHDPPLLIDVLPSPRRPAGISDDLWFPPERYSIPGSVWLPNTGFGVLPVEEGRYLRANLERLTGGDRSRPIVIFCLADCWMSWNAARRAVAWGYTSVIWYPHGTDDWEAAGLPLAEVSPVPRAPGQ